MPRKRTRQNNEESPVTTTVFDPRAMAAEVTETDVEMTRTTTRDKYADNPWVDVVRESRENGKTYGLDVQRDQANEVSGWLRDAARKADSGVGIRYRYHNADGEPVTVSLVKDLPEGEYPVHVAFVGKAARKVAAKDRVECPECNREVSVNRDNTIRNHKGQDGQCPGSGRATELVDEDTD